MKYNNVWYIPFATLDKLLDALVTKVELNTFFDATNTPSKVNTPIGLGTMDVNTNDRDENKHGVVPHHVEGSISRQHLLVPIV
jgi:hypothetical protein